MNRMEEHRSLEATPQPVVQPPEESHCSTSSATSSSESLVSTSSAPSSVASSTFVQPTTDEDFFELLMNAQVRVVLPLTIPY